MDIEKIIDRKTEAVLKEIEKRQVSTKEEATEEIKQFVEQLKSALDMHPIAAEDILQAIEKGGAVYRKEHEAKDIEHLMHLATSEMYIGGGGVHSYKLQRWRVTIIAEPLESE